MVSQLLVSQLEDNHLFSSKMSLLLTDSSLCHMLLFFQTSSASFLVDRELYELIKGARPIIWEADITSEPRTVLFLTASFLIEPGLQVKAMPWNFFFMESILNDARA